LEVNICINQILSEGWQYVGVSFDEVAVGLDTQVEVTGFVADGESGTMSTGAATAVMPLNSAFTDNSLFLACMGGELVETAGTYTM